MGTVLKILSSAAGYLPYEKKHRGNKMTKAFLSEDNLRDIVSVALRRHLLNEGDSGETTDPPETVEQKIERLATNLYNASDINVSPTADASISFELTAMSGGSQFILDSPAVYSATSGVPAAAHLGVFKRAEGGKTATDKDVNTQMAAALVKYISGSELVAKIEGVTGATDSPILIPAREGDTKKPGGPDAIQLEIAMGKIYGAKAVYDKKTVALMVLGARQKGRKAGKDGSDKFGDGTEATIKSILSPEGTK